MARRLRTMEPEVEPRPTTAREVQIPPPQFTTAEFRITGTAPYMQARFAKKSEDMMREKMEAGSQARKGKKRSARDFDDDFEQAKHVSREGWCGIPASAFRMALISACRLVGFKMTLAKLTLFVEADGFDKIDGTPLVKLEGKPARDMRLVRNATGVADIRARPRWDTWHAIIRVRFDSEQFSLTDVSNLLMRVGMQVGIGEGRPDSKASAGLGFGLFDIATSATKERDHNERRSRTGNHQAEGPATHVASRSNRRLRAKPGNGAAQPV